jgi:hypothetical protein
MPRAMRVEYPGAIYHVMDRGDRREDILIIGTAKGAKSLPHRSGRGPHQHNPARADEPCVQLEFESTVFFFPKASLPFRKETATLSSGCPRGK